MYTLLYKCMLVFCQGFRKSFGGNVLRFLFWELMTKLVR